MPKPARQYTVRNVPDAVERSLRRRAKETGKSFNQVVLDALSIGAGEPPRPKRDLSEIVGSLSEKEADHVDSEVGRQRQIDADLWK